MSETTQEQIDGVKEAVQALANANPALVKAAHVDDWGRNGNFSVHVKPANPDRYTTSRLKAAMRKLLPKGSHIRALFPPAMSVDRITGKRSYSPRSWVIDIDFQRYNPADNSFAKVAA